MRLHHKEEAKEAYQRCLDAKFSYKAWMKLLEMYADEGDLQRALQAAIRLTAYQHRCVSFLLLLWNLFIDYVLRLGIIWRCRYVVSSFNSPDIFLLILVVIVPHRRCASPLQTRPNPRTRQDLVYPDEHGFTRAPVENYGGLPPLWPRV